MLGAVAVTHAPSALQQPAHVKRSHPTMQMPAVQLPFAHVAQRPPPSPQASSAVPGWHASLSSQQPRGQVVAVQLRGGRHAPSWHVSAPVHALHSPAGDAESPQQARISTYATTATRMSSI